MTFFMKGFICVCKIFMIVKLIRSLLLIILISKLGKEKIKGLRVFWKELWFYCRILLKVRKARDLIKKSMNNIKFKQRLLKI